MNLQKSIKDKLYDLLMLTCSEGQGEEGDINISQNLGIAMTSAVKKGGVINIISQKIQFQKVVPKIIDIIKEVDLIEAPVGNPVPQIEYLKDPVEECCEFFFDNKATWKEFKETMRIRYLDYVRKNTNSNSEASRFLNVHSSFVTKTLKQLENEIEECE